MDITETGFGPELKLAQARLERQRKALAATEVGLQNAIKANLGLTIKALGSKKVRQAAALKETEALIAEIQGMLAKGGKR